MKFLIDAQLPRRLSDLLRGAGHDAMHTLDLPDASHTSDVEILSIAAREQRVVVTKDADFVNSFVLMHQPEKLLLISTGNISNADLDALLLPNIDAIAEALGTCDMVELTRTTLIVHS